MGKQPTLQHKMWAKASKNPTSPTSTISLLPTFTFKPVIASKKIKYTLMCAHVCSYIHTKFKWKHARNSNFLWLTLKILNNTPDLENTNHQPDPPHSLDL